MNVNVDALLDRIDTVPSAKAVKDFLYAYDDTCGDGFMDRTPEVQAERVAALVAAYEVLSTVLDAPEPRVVGYMAIGEDGQLGNFRGPQIRGTVAAVEEQLVHSRGPYWRIAEVREVPGTTADELAARRGVPTLKIGTWLRALVTFRSITGDRIVEGEVYEVRCVDHDGLPILTTDHPHALGGWLPGQLEPVTEENDR